MKKRFLIAGSLMFLAFVLKANKQDTIPVQDRKAEVELVYNHYIQDGDNSAINGGEGSETLTVYGPGITADRDFKKHSMSLNIGTDVISSASTDRIDNVVSSASSIDARIYINTGFSRDVNNESLRLSAGGGVSVESDYYSLNGYVGLSKTSQDRRSSYSGELRYFDDDLRWGRITATIYEPRKLIYPVELRGKESLDGYKRRSYLLNLGYDYILNARNVFGVHANVTHQSGILSTPFHRVYKSNGQVTLERLPSERWKGSASVQWNTFLKEKIILKQDLGVYSDDFGIRSVSVGSEAVYKLNPFVSMIGRLRLYHQSESDYFEAFGMHEPDTEFVTSDYDQSSFQSLNVGGGIKIYPYWAWSKSIFADEIQLNYSYYKRTNGLYAHFLNVAFRLRKQKPR